MSSGNRSGSRVEASPTINSELQKYLLECIQKNSDHIVQQVQAQFKQMDLALKDVKDRIIGVEEHVSNLKSIVDGLSQAASEEASRMKKKRKVVSPDGEKFLAELEDESSDFKARLREGLRKFCLGAEGHMYFQGRKAEFASEQPYVILNLKL
jgi:ABC-type transporter Mla subunit MlaD